MESVDSLEACLEFDQLCTLCSKMFDGTIDWRHLTTMAHLDIYSMSVSADKGCHICSLILADIHPEVIVHLKHDLDRFLVDPSEQVAISISMPPEDLTIRALSPSRPPLEFFDPTESDRFLIGRLTIMHAEDDYTQQNRSRSRSNYSSSTRTQITHWLRQCLSTHSECFAMQTVTTTRDILPTRLLDLKDVVHNGQVRLVATKDLPCDTIYATLSHCWGGQCAFRLTVDNLPMLESGFAESCLPKTFRDAISITVDLGVRWLFIDALTIIQDSVDDQDWLHEASIMGDVYANSYITLAASTSPNSAGGLFYRRNPLAVWPCRLATSGESFDNGTFVIGTSSWARERSLKPLIDRAWAFQEWLLSKRLIHFSDDQVRWECFSLAASEVFPQGLDEYDLEYHGTPTKGIISALRNEPENRQTLWERIRIEYSEKALSKPGDRLTAFSGIARMAHKVLGSSPRDYLAGIWKPIMLEELLWTRSMQENQPRNRNQYIAPTWSWMSLNGPFEWNNPSVFANAISLKCYAQIMDTEVVPVDDIFGLLQGAKLILQCLLSTVTLSASTNKAPTWRHDYSWTVTAIRGIPTTVDCCLNLDYAPMFFDTPSTQLSFRFVPIVCGIYRYNGHPEVHGLLLKNCLGSEEQYIRVGVLEIYLGDTNRDQVLKLLNIQYGSETRPTTEEMLHEHNIIELV